jgi:hypothetical protein
MARSARRQAIATNITPARNVAALASGYDIYTLLNANNFWSSPGFVALPRIV